MQYLRLFLFGYVALKMQKSTLEKNFEEEKRVLMARITELEQKLQNVIQDLSIANATIAMRNTALDELQNNSRELDELREWKAVYIIVTLFNILFLIKDKPDCHIKSLLFGNALYS